MARPTQGGRGEAQVKEWNTGTWGVGFTRWDQIGRSLYYKRKARCGSGRSEIAGDGKGEVPAGDPIQRLKSGSGWGTREPLIRRSKSKHFVVPRDRLSHCGEQKHVAPSCEPRMMTTSRLFVSRRSLQRRTLGTYPALPWNHDALFLLLRSTRTKFKSHIGSQYTSTVVGDYRLSPKGLHKLRCFRNTSGERPTRLQM